MSEYMLVESPQFFPQACVCGNQKGPLVDTLITTAGNRIYVCSLCVKRCAKELGLVKGERMDKLVNAGALLDAASSEVEQLNQVVQQQMAVNAELRASNEALNVLLQQERDGKLTRQHLVRTIQESAHTLLETA